MSVPQKAIQYVLPKVGDYRNLKQQEVDVPKPRYDEVLVKVHAVSLQYRDFAIAKGFYNVGVSENIVPCSDMAGEIVAVGEEVKGWKVGDRVCANFCTDHLHGDPTPESIKSSLGGQSPGVLTQYRTFPAHSLVTIPSHLSYVEASTLPCAALTAYNALVGPTPVRAGETVLVLGTGGVSIFGLQLAVASGATVIATSSSDEKLKIAKKLGAHHVINYNKTPNWDEEVKKITNGRGVDRVIEVGGPGTLAKSLSSVRIGGSVQVIGFVGQGEGTTMDVILPVISKSILVRGVYIGPVSEFEAMNRLIEAHPETTRPVVDKVFPFDQAADAWAHLESQKHVGKIVIQVAQN
ncbi:alcohol dehydrogenase superfamily protein [Coprinopsis cinerea okayama7|uniref:Alcohol dehydrogenase superfamily protein n=1 Tax=Coprinopsis cinerea (strain Okayama-7 / 130 / ATCC MYA-4618 / FGSC 9003) TaxID=240176 RepID=A8NI93_COPC7|nr:alcohol dehydrogenase superfamily protein [Coprinopsis cinerea okayama7\|eukprot:XP_001833941.1 alcohol dehydrogenase superfamily protein [Coprinopsis cinerea okayama7\